MIKTSQVLCEASVVHKRLFSQMQHKLLSHQQFVHSSGSRTGFLEHSVSAIQKFLAELLLKCLFRIVKGFQKLRKVSRFAAIVHLVCTS